MGTKVYDCKEEIREGAHVFCHSRKDGQKGFAYLVINNSAAETTVALPGEATLYTLQGKDGLRSPVMTLNGRDLTLNPGDELPELTGEAVSGQVTLPAASCSFIVL